MNSFLRIITIFLFIFLHIYWRFKHKGTAKILDFGIKPFKGIFQKSVFSYTQVFVLLQLGGFTLLPIPSLHPVIINLAFLMAVSGFIICIAARQSLGKSWIDAKDYQRASSPQLVTSGVYKYIRHPIYLGLNFMITGAEILTQSYLILFLPLLYLWTYKHAIKEERHLLSYFGNKYKAYKVKTGMFFLSLFKK